MPPFSPTLARVEEQISAAAALAARVYDPVLAEFDNGDDNWGDDEW